MPEDADQIIEAVGRRIGELRAQVGKTQAEVAEALGTTVSNYQRIEGGVQNVTLKMLTRIANVIGVKVAEFFTEPETPKRKRGRPRTQPPG